MKFGERIIKSLKEAINGERLIVTRFEKMENGDTKIVREYDGGEVISERIISGKFLETK